MKTKWHKFPDEEPPFPEGLGFYYVTEEYFDEYGEKTMHDVGVDVWDGFKFMHNSLVTAWAEIPLPKPFETREL